MSFKSSTTFSASDLTCLFDVPVATGTSNRHVKSLAEKVVDDLKDNKVQILGIEGTESQDWILIDAGDVLVNVMNEESREHYDLESIWDRAKR